jgi:glycosyltransferase involved in cell wall biosynthesis
MTKKRLSILVPVYNEIRTIDLILEKLTNLPIENYQLIIVDDCSSDGTTEFLQNWQEVIAPKLKKKLLISFFYHEVNKGKGAAIQTGLKAAKGKYFIVQDADLEYEPNEIVKILVTAEIDKAKVVYGSRFMGRINGMKKTNYFANLLFNLILNTLYGTHITDMHTCYKMFETSIIKNIRSTSQGFGYDTDLSIGAIQAGLEIKEIPISYLGRSHEDGKKIGFSDGVECLQKIISSRFSGKKLYIPKVKIYQD